VNESRSDPMQTARYGEPMAAEFNPIVPDDAVTSRALLVVIAILSFLAALAVGAILIAQSIAGEWRNDIAREVTIELRPASGRDLDADARLAEEIARALPGIVDAHALTNAEISRLLAPWLGTDADLAALPIPHLVRAKVDNRAPPDLGALRRTLAGALPNAALDDHQGFASRLGSITDAVTLAGLAILVLVLTATMLAISFATRAAVAANRAVVEVLHFVGAREAFVARIFARHFLVLGLKGGLIGAGAAALLFGLARLLATLFGAPAGPFSFGQLGLDWRGFLWIAALGGTIALTTALSSRLTVHRTLRAID